MPCNTYNTNNTYNDINTLIHNILNAHKQIITIQERIQLINNALITPDTSKIMFAIHVSSLVRYYAVMNTWAKHLKNVFFFSRLIQGFEGMCVRTHASLYTRTYTAHACSCAYMHRHTYTSTCAHTHTRTHAYAQLTRALSHVHSHMRTLTCARSHAHAHMRTLTTLTYSNIL